MNRPLRFALLAVIFTMATITLTSLRVSAEESEVVLSRIQDPNSVKDHFLNNLLKAADAIEKAANGVDEQKKLLKREILAQALDSKQNNIKGILNEKSNSDIENQIQQKDSQSLKETRKTILEKVLPTAQGLPIEVAGGDEYKAIVKRCLDSAIRTRAEQIGVATAKPTQANVVEEFVVRTIKRTETLQIPARESDGNFALLKSPKTIKDYYVNCLLEEAASKVVVDRESGDIPALLWAQAYYTKSSNDLALIDSEINSILEDTLRDHGLKAALNKLELIKSKLLPKIHNYPGSKEAIASINSAIGTSIMRAIVFKGLQENLLPQDRVETLRSAMDKYSGDNDQYISGKSDKQMELMAAFSAQASAAQNLIITVFDAAKKKGLDTYGQTFNISKRKFILELKRNIP